MARLPCLKDFGSFLLLVLWRITFLAHGFSAHFDAMGIVNNGASSLDQN